MSPAPTNDGQDVDVSRPVNILLVDDQPGRLLTYRTILEPLGERMPGSSFNARS